MGYDGCFILRHFYLFNTFACRCDCFDPGGSPLRPLTFTSCLTKQIKTHFSLPQVNSEGVDIKSYFVKRVQEKCVKALAL